MNNRFIRMRRYNPKSTSGKFDVLFPQGMTENILRSENGGVLESDLLQYDRHLGDHVVHMNRALSTGTARALSVRIKDAVLTDCFPLLLTLHVGLECEPTLSFNGGEPHEIISASGDRIPGGQIVGSTIFLVWNATLQKWILQSSDNFTDVTKIVLPVESSYTYQAPGDDVTIIVIPGFNKKSDKLQVNYGQTILRAGIDYEFLHSANDTIQLLGFGLDAGDILYFTITTYITTAKRGHYRYELKAVDKVVTAMEDGTTVFQVPKEAEGAHSLVINYNQTILRNNLDYEFNETKTEVTLTKFALSKGEDLIFTITQFVEAPGELVPNNWGATGNYRYSLNVVHGSYTATEDGITVFAVPGFNHRRDDISIIQNNHLYIYDVDYTIDEIGNVVLLKQELARDEEIFYTILQGAMMDVPNFNVIQANGYDGQHIILDMSYSVLCNFYTLLIRLKHDIKTAPTIKCVDGPAEMVVDCFKSPILGGYKAGSYLWVVYSESEHLWYSLSHSQIDISSLIPQHKHATGEANFTGIADDGTMRETVIPHNLGMKPERIDINPIEPPTVINGEITTIGDIWSYADEVYLYVGNSGKSVSKFHWAVTVEDATNDLRSYIDQQITELKQRPGNIILNPSTYEAIDDTTAIYNIANFDASCDKIIVNFNQTVLRENIDYRVNVDNNGIDLINGFMLTSGDILQFVVVEQVVE